MSASYDLRLVGYTPLGNRIGVIPDLGITVTTSASGPTLNAVVSTAVYGTLPVSLEVGVEYWHSSTQTWTEPRDCRFAITQQAYDDRDPTGTTTLTGIGVGAYLMAAAALAGVEPYVNTTGTSEVAASSTTVSLSNDTFTWPSHIFGDGDRIHITNNGSANKKLKAGLYFVRAPTTNTFKISTTPLGTAKTGMGTANNIHAERVVTRIVFSGGHNFARSSQVVTQGGAALGLSDGTAYYVVNPTAATIQLSNHPNGVPITLSAASTNVAQVYRYLDGQRIFTNAHPGTVLSSAFNEAKARGWGVGPTDEVTHGWTTTADSAGNAWTSMADDPSTPGVSVGFQPGTPMTTMLQFMLDNQYAEWYTAGRIINVVNYGTGTDHTTGSAPKRIGTEASQLPVTVDLTNMRNSFIIRGTGPILREKDGATGAWGRLEAYETASGITTKTTADRQGSADIAANGNPQVGYTITEMAQEAQYLPGLHFSRGDWVSVQLAGSGWTKLRVIGWTLDKAASGAITVTNVLQYQKRLLVAKALKASVSASASISDSGTSTSPLLESDNRKPSAPVIAAPPTLVGSFGSDASAVCTATVTWNAVTTDININPSTGVGSDITSAVYQVWLRPEAADNGASVGTTAALTYDLHSLPSGQTYAVSVRAQSDQGEWGEFSNEVEFTTLFPSLPPGQPTAPSLTSSLAGVRVAWDGYLLDPSDGVTKVAPDAGFSYVYVIRGTSAAAITGGTGTVVGTNMGHAGYAVDNGLAINTTYYYALVAVNTVGTASVVSAVSSVTVQGVVGADIAANTILANSILAGSITADQMNLGTIPTGSPTDRVPMPLTQTSFWGVVTTGNASKGVFGTSLNAVSGASGIVLTSTAAAGSNGAWCWVTQQVPDVPSSTIYLSGVSASGVAQFFVREWTNVSTNTSTDTAIPLAPQGQSYALKSTTVAYGVFVAVAGPASDTVSAAHVFEAVGAGYDYEGVTIQPDGIRIYSGENANPVLSLTSSSETIITVSDAAGDHVAGIDPAGNASFTEVTAEADFDIQGSTLLGPAVNNLAHAIPNGGVIPWNIGNPSSVPGDGTIGLLDIPGRSVPYAATWATMQGKAITWQYYAIASDVFQVEDGRVVMLLINNGALQVNNPAGDANVYLDLQLCLTPMPAANGGTGAVRISRSVVLNGNGGNYVEQATFWRTSAAQATIDTANFVLPANVPIYWQYNTDAGSVPSGFTFSEFGNVRQFAVVDLGSSQALGTGGFAVATDGRVTGAQTIPPAGSTGTPTSTTVTFTAHGSRSWNANGIVNSGGQWGNPAAMYYGVGASAMGSWFGNFQDSNGVSMASRLSGKTITAASLYLKNNYMAYSGASAPIGWSTTSGTPSSEPSGNGNASFNHSFSAGAGTWITLPTGWRSAFGATTASGNQLQSLQIGPGGSTDNNYMYFAGYSQSNPPQLKITFHS